jgi:hypothetical protein
VIAERDVLDLPTDALGAIPDFPVEILPTAVRSLVESGGLPTTLVAGASLAALATAIGPKAQIERPDHTYKQRAILFVPLIAQPGYGKSPAQDIAFGPLRDHDATHFNQAEQDEALTSKQRAKDPTLLVDDITLEALQNRLVAADGSVTLDCDELAQFIHSLGEYKSGHQSADQARVLKMWSGEPLHVIRVTRGNLLVPDPTVVVVGGLVPSAHELLGGSDDGFRPRWLPHYASSSSDPYDDATRITAEWTHLLTVALLPQRATYRTWTLSEEADLVFRQAQVRWREQARGPEPAGVSAAMLKADFQCLRIALVLAEADHPGRGGAVHEETIERAVAWVEFVLNCWRALPEKSGPKLPAWEELLNYRADAIRDHVERCGVCTKRELLQAHVGGIRTQDDLDKSLARYQEIYGTGLVESLPVAGGVTTKVYPPWRTSIGAARRSQPELGAATKIASSGHSPLGAANRTNVIETFPNGRSDLKSVVSPSQVPPNPASPNPVENGLHGYTRDVAAPSSKPETEWDEPGWLEPDDEPF